jgi:hypothetical protein
VQGINDLVTPFLSVFLSEVFAGSGSDMDAWQLDELSAHALGNVEADCYWCLAKLLDCIQDHYTFAQPGIQRQVCAPAPLQVNNRAHVHPWAATSCQEAAPLTHPYSGGPPLRAQVFKLGELVRRIDAAMFDHIEGQGLQFLQFAFRWYNCLMLREVPFSLVRLPASPHCARTP